MTATLTTLAPDPILDLDPWVGQRQCTFRFALVHGITGQPLGDIHPIRGATLSHDTGRTIKRQLSMNLGVEDTAAVNPLTDRVDVFMVFGTTEYPLGRYMFTAPTRQRFTSGLLSSNLLTDEMFLVDQEITVGFNAAGNNVSLAIQQVLSGLPVTIAMEPTTLDSVQSWSVGTSRGQLLEALALSGDYFSPWFGNDKKIHFIRAFDPAARIPQFNYDAGNQVLRSGVVESDDILQAPNRFVVVSNAATDMDNPVVGVADVPVTAPHSIPNRGFVIQQTENLQVADNTQAATVARNLALRQTVFEQVSLNVAPDPRHDSYSVIRWQDELWLELSWSMRLVEGGEMSLLLRKSYT